MSLIPHLSSSIVTDSYDQVITVVRQRVPLLAEVPASPDAILLEDIDSSWMNHASWTAAGTPANPPDR